MSFRKKSPATLVAWRTTLFDRCVPASGLHPEAGTHQFLFYMRAVRAPPFAVSHLHSRQVDDGSDEI